MMEDTGMEESLDAGSIPASSIKKQSTLLALAVFL